MTPAVRRITFVAVTALSSVLAACSNPVAPTRARLATDAPHADGLYAGGIGRSESDTVQSDGLYAGGIGRTASDSTQKP